VTLVRDERKRQTRTKQQQQQQSRKRKAHTQQQVTAAAVCSYEGDDGYKYCIKYVWIYTYVPFSIHTFSTYSLVTVYIFNTIEFGGVGGVGFI